jgi:Domain of unknown function (DUF397)
MSDLNGLDWRKATASGNNGCVEVAPLTDGGVAVRDSKDPQSPVLAFTRREWTAFLDGMGKGEFDHLV